MRPLRVVLHVGLPAAGAVLQPLLRQLRPQLHAHGVGYVGDARIRALGHRAGWRTGPAAQAAHSDAFTRDFAGLVAAERRAVLHTSGRSASALFVASDALLGGRGLDADGGFYPHAADAVAHVVAALGEAQVRILVHTLRQDHLLEQDYLRRVERGTWTPIAEQFPHRFEPFADYGDLVARLRSVPGVTEVVVRPLELIDAGTLAWLDDVLGQVGLTGRLDLFSLHGDVSSFPRLLSARGARLAVELDPLLDDAAERRDTGAYLRKQFGVGERYGTDVLSTSERRRILAAYDRSNRALFREHLSDLPEDSYANDTATFALGNVLPQPGPRQPLTARDRWQGGVARSLVRAGAAARLGRRALGAGRRRLTRPAR